MYNIGLFSFDKSDYEKYVKLESNTKVHIDLLEKGKLVENVLEYDAILIIEQNVQDILMICELIFLIKKKCTPLIWVISHKNNHMNQIIYLQLGIDGVIDNELDSEVIKLSLINTLKRYKKNGKSQVDKISDVLDIQLLPANGSVLLNDLEICLTQFEFKVMACLYAKRGETVRYEEIYENVWGNDNSAKYKNYRVSNLIFHLRRKLELDPTHPQYIKTVRSKGYRLS